MFNEKDEVIIVKSKYDLLVGVRGTVIRIIKEGSEGVTYGLKLEKNMNLHDLDGKCEFGYGWYVLEHELELVNNSKLCRLLKKDNELITLIRESSAFVYGNSYYQIRKNGALTFLTNLDRKVFVYKDGSPNPIKLDIKSEEDYIVVNHLIEAYRIMPMKQATDNGMNAYTQKESDELEESLFPSKEVKIELPKSLEPTVGIDTVAGKVYQTEAELYAELGIEVK